MELGFKKELHLIPNGNSHIMPMACFNLITAEKRRICGFLSSIKYPNGFASNICQCIKHEAFHIFAMKSHDFHIFLQRILWLAVQGNLIKEIQQVISELNDFFKKLCSRTLCKDVVDDLEQQIALILCKLQEFFPLPFLTLWCTWWSTFQLRLRLQV